MSTPMQELVDKLEVATLNALIATATQVKITLGKDAYLHFCKHVVEGLIDHVEEDSKVH